MRLGERWGADDHPLLADEIARRPRDLAFQVRDAMRQRLDRNHFGLTVVMLLEVWRVLAGRRWQEPLDLALTVFSAFPIAFAGDPAEAVFSEIGVVLAKNLSAPVLDAPGTIEKTIQLYTKVVPKASQE
ncbi:MAG: hypothetical protein NVV74_05880 [Magnetospirillum sp.]|nr:hypothetical protein [Magnetospirillum sp.]